MQDYIDNPDNVDSLVFAHEFLNHAGCPDIAVWKGAWFAYGSGYYRELPHADLKLALQAYVQNRYGVMEPKLLASLVKETWQMIRMLAQVRADIDLDSWIGESASPIDPPFVSFANGLYSPVTDTLVSHSPDWFVTFRPLEFPYDPSVEHPKWSSCLERLLPDPQDRSTIQELFGYCLTPGNRYKKFFVLVGESDCGKSTVLNVLKMILGADNVSATPVNKLGTRFGAFAAWASLANITGEGNIGEGDFDEDMLKAWCGGRDTVEVEGKQRDAKPVVPRSKIIFGTNTIPHFKDRSEAMNNRFLPVVFPCTIPKAEQIPDFEETLRDELPGIAAWAVDGLKRLEANRGFSRSIASVAKVEEHRIESRPEERYLLEHFRFKQGAWTPAPKLSGFQVWARYEGIDAKGIGADLVGKAIRKVFGERVTPKIRRKGDDVLRGWENLERMKGDPGMRLI